MRNPDCTCDMVISGAGAYAGLCGFFPEIHCGNVYCNHCPDVGNCPKNPNNCIGDDVNGD